MVIIKPIIKAIGIVIYFSSYNIVGMIDCTSIVYIYYMVTVFIIFIVI